jgi:hypothetical protein
MSQQSGSEIIREWPEESREAAQLVIDAYGEPPEATPSQLTWFGVGPWKRVVAAKVFFEHSFPAPHIDSVESVIDYRLPAQEAHLYMEKLRVEPGRNTADPDERMLSDEDLEQAAREGQRDEQGSA